MDKGLMMTQKEIDRVFELQTQYKWDCKKTSAKERIRKLKKLLAYIIKHKEEIQRAVYKDFRKPGEEVLLTEIYPVTSGIKHTIRHLEEWMKDKKVRTPLTHFGAECKIKYEPRGVVLIVSPWNFPFQLSIDPLVSAAAAGNCVMLKPSEFSPNTTACIKKLIKEVFEENEAAVFEGDYRVSEMLLKKPFDHIFFTGSPAVGKIVMEAAAKHLTSVTLELGGKSPVIIDKQADLEEAAKKIAWGKCLNAGQICVAPDYVLIHEEQKELFVKLVIKHIKRFYGDIHRKSQGMKYCSIITEKHFKRIKELINEAKDKGAKVRFGANYDEQLRFISPTILTDIPVACQILEEEIFGPVLPVLTYKSVNEAVKYIQSKPKPLALYVFSRDKKFVSYVLTHTESGDVMINDVILHTANVNLPFGGINNSGVGKSHGYHGFMAFTHERSYSKQPKRSAASLFYPPYKDETKGIIEKFIKYL